MPRQPRLRSATARALLIALLSAAGLAGCAADATAPLTGSLHDGRPAAAIANLTQAPVLYDQSLDDNGIMSISTPLSALMADEFVVPSGETWTVAQLVVSGRLGADFTSLPLSIRQDNGGAPGAVVPGANVTQSPTSNATNPCCGNITDYLFDLETPVTLQPGTYWLAAEVTTGGATHFEWHARGPQSGAAALASIDGGEHWDMSLAGTTLGFVLFSPASAKQAQSITFPAVTPNPAIVGGAAALGAFASSGLAVSYSALTPTVCTVSGSTVSFIGVGECRIAADQAGNAGYLPAAQEIQRADVDYQFAGFAQPVDNDGPNSAKAGQAIPLKWRLTDANGDPVTTLATAAITAKSLSCAFALTPDLLEEYAASGSGLQNLGNGYYQLNWKTPTSFAKSCKALHLDLGEGSGTRTAVFHFTK